jgi:hypothetical protein
VHDAAQVIVTGAGYLADDGGRDLTHACEATRLVLPGERAPARLLRLQYSLLLVCVLDELG